MMFNIVLVQPQIPQNTGNVVRSCAATGCSLHLVGPLGFSVSDKYLKRAGLDYWEQVDINIYSDFEEFEEKNPGRYFLCTTKTQNKYTDFKYKENDYFVFGSETFGLEDSIHQKYNQNEIRIPMKPEIRCFNLATSVGIIMYEALRQTGFDGLL